MRVIFEPVRDGVRLPEYKSSGASGMDMYYQSYLEPLVLRPGCRATVPGGFKLQLPCGYEAQVRGRSGRFAKEGLHVELGTIDADYRGEVGVMIQNMGHYDIVLRGGERFAQLVIAPVVRVAVVSGLVDSTERGTGGFGSTGGDK